MPRFPCHSSINTHSPPSYSISIPPWQDLAKNYFDGRTQQAIRDVANNTSQSTLPQPLASATSNLVQHVNHYCLQSVQQPVKRKCRMKESLHVAATASRQGKTKPDCPSKISQSPLPQPTFRTTKTPTKQTAQGPEYLRNKQLSKQYLTESGTILPICSTWFT